MDSSIISEKNMNDWLFNGGVDKIIMHGYDVVDILNAQGVDKTKLNNWLFKKDENRVEKYIKDDYQINFLRGCREVDQIKLEKALLEKDTKLNEKGPAKTTNENARSPKKGYTKNGSKKNMSPKGPSL
jgi:hypothetical protein